MADQSQKRKRRVFTAEYRIEAARRVIETGRPIALSLSVSGVASAPQEEQVGYRKHAPVSSAEGDQPADGVLAARVSREAEELLESVHAERSLSSSVTERIGSTVDLVELRHPDFTIRDKGLPNAASIGTVAPSLDKGDGQVSLHVEGIDGAFAMKVKDGDVLQARDSAVIVQGENAKAVSHVTDDLSGQIVAVLDARAGNYVDFQYSLPLGYRLAENTSGGFDLISPLGTPEGTVDPGWAFDAEGRAVATSYQLIGNDTMRQFVDISNATSPITLDPSWWWWAATSAKCAGEIAVAFTPLKIAKVAKSFYNIAKKSKVAAAAIRVLGGPTKAATVVLKEMANRLKRSASRYGWSRVLPSFSLTADQKRQAGRIIAFMGANTWEFLGFGSCGALLAEVRK